MATNSSTMYTEILRHDFNAFVHRAFLELNAGTIFRSNWHHEVLAAKLEEVRRGECRRLIINIPPRHLKSHTASIAFPAWLLGHDPTKRILTVSYAQDLSDKLARDSRALMMSGFYGALFSTRLSPDRQSVGDFETTKGGHRYSTSVNGVVTGRGADIIIIDDPLKADEALSELRRKGVNEWYDNTLRSRLNSQDTGAIVIVMQRLHADDLIAHVQEHEAWEVVSFPAVAEVNTTYDISTPYGRREVCRQIGDPLQPALVSASRLDQLRSSMTAYNFAAQYQQDPQPPAGVIIRREWLKFYTSLEKPTTFKKIIQSWDTANKSTELSDYSACTTWGWENKSLYLLDVFRRRMEFPELKRTVVEMASRWNADVVLVEDKASGTQLIQQLVSERFRKIQAAPALDGDKLMRLHSQASKIENGVALFPKSAVWLDAYLLELTTFPNSRNDDQVDSTVNALAWGTKEASRPVGFFS